MLPNEVSAVTAMSLLAALYLNCYGGFNPCLAIFPVFLSLSGTRRLSDYPCAGCKFGCLAHISAPFRPIGYGYEPSNELKSVLKHPNFRFGPDSPTAS
jgi:hypothetical protein